MATVIIPIVLSFLLGPGTGQLYNREFKKGAFLIVMSLLILIAAAVWFRQTALPYFPDDILQTGDPGAIQAAVQSAMTHVMSEHGFTFYTYEFLLFGLWLYSVVDAYLGAGKRKAKPQP